MERSMLTDKQCKLGTSFLAFICLAAWFMETRATGRTKRTPQYKGDAVVSLHREST